jgi:replicative DNA helicase
MSRVELGRIKNPNDEEGLSDEHWGRISNVMPAIKNSLLQIDDSTGQTIHHMRSRLNRFKRDNGKYPTAVYLDYVQIMDGSGEYRDNRTKEMGEIAKGLKDIAKDFNIPVIALSQLNRSLENRVNKRPVNSDLRESGELEQVADVITFLYRDEVYHKDSPYKGLCELIISKNRDGETGMVGSQFEGQFVSFSGMGGREFPEYQEEKNRFNG